MAVPVFRPLARYPWKWSTTFWITRETDKRHLTLTERVPDRVAQAMLWRKENTDYFKRQLEGYL